MLGDFPFVLRDACRLLPPYLAQQWSSRHYLVFFQFRCGDSSELENPCPTNDRLAASTDFVRKLANVGKSDIVRIE